MASARLRGTLLLLIPLALLAAGPDRKAVDAQLSKLAWATGAVHLASSNATLHLPAGSHAVTGTDAKTFSRLINGDSDDPLEAVSMSKTSTIYYEFNGDGYVSADDWKDVDAQQMLDNITKNTEDANADRASHGVAALHVLGWIQQPAYDKKSNTVRWSLKAKADDDKEPIVNSVALVLGRRGYERITYVTDLPDFGSGAAIDGAITGLAFDRGARYQDFANGDKLAGFGIAALVGTAAGATIAKTVGFGGLLLLIKKFGILLVAGAAAAWRWISARVKGVVRGE